MTATSVTFNNATIAENTADGVFIHDSNIMDAFASSFTDFAIQNSYLGAAPNPMGGTFAGNGGDGFFGGNTTFTGVAFLDSFFNANGGDGIDFFNSTILSGVATSHAAPALTTGFA